MRNLTIHRQKAFAGCAAAMKVYIEDEALGDTLIDGVKCRLLGKLKNGKSLTAPIDEASRRVYVIAGKASKSFCYDYRTVFAGTEDVVLQGKNEFNPLVGNPFRFEGTPSAEVLASHKKGAKRGIWVLIISVILGLVIGIGLSSVMLMNGAFGPTEKTFSVDEMSITLTDEFTPQAQDGYDGFFVSRRVGVVVLKEPASDFPEDLTRRGYAELIIQATDSAAGAQITDLGNMHYFSYEAENGGLPYTYCTFIYESNDAFWVVQFYCMTGHLNRYEAQFHAWADGVTFAGNVI